MILGWRAGLFVGHIVAEMRVLPVKSGGCVIAVPSLP